MNFREAVSYLKGDSIALSTAFPLLFTLILGFERALLSSHKYQTDILLLNCTNPFLLSTSSVQVHMHASESLSLDTE